MLTGDMSPSGGLQAKFRGQVPARIQSIVAGVNALRSGGWIPEQVAELVRLVRDFRWAAESHDSVLVAQVTLVLEQALQRYLALPAAGRADGRRVVDQAMAHFGRLAQVVVDPSAIHDDEALLLEEATPEAGRAGFDVVALVSDRNCREWLRASLAHTVYRLHLLPDPSSVQTFLETMGAFGPLAVLCCGEQSWLLNVLKPVSACAGGRLPLVALGHHDELPQARQLLRAGASHVLDQDDARGALIGLLDSLAQQQPEQSLAVLLLHEPGEEADALAAILQQAGLRVRRCQTPTRCLEDPQALQVDVVIVGPKVADWSGTELAAVLRSRHPTAQWALIRLFERDSDPALSWWEGDNERLVHVRTPAPQLLATITAAGRQQRARRSVSSSLQMTLYERHLEQMALDQHAIVSTTDRQGRIMYVNDTFCEISGYSREELLGENHRLVKSGLHDADFYADMWRTIRAGRVWRGELCNRRRDGSLYWVESTIMPFLDGDGQPYQYVSLRTDITHVKATEAALREQRDMERVISAAAAELTSAEAAGLDACLTRALERVAGFLGADTAYVMQLDEGADEFRRTHEWPPGREQPHAGAQATQALLRAPWCADALVEQRIIQVDDVNCMGDEASLERRILQRREVGAFVVLPMRVKGRVRGFLGFDARCRAHEWPQHAVAQLPMFAKLINTTLERTRAQREVEQYKERLRIGQLFANIGTWEWELETDRLFWTERIASLFGYQEGKVTTSYGAFMAAVHPDDRLLVEQGIRRCLQEDAPYEVEHRVVWADGSVRWLLERGSVVRAADGRPLRMIGVVQDIHDRKQAELELAERERQLRESQRIAHLGSWSADTTTGAMWWSDEVYRIFGRPQDFVPSVAGFYQQVHPDDVALVQLGQERAEACGRYELVHRIVRQDGSVRHVRILAEAVGGAGARLNGILQDVTERVETQRAMVLALEEAERANRAKSEFLSRMSHELRTPMNVILGFAQLLELEESLDAEGRDNVQEILAAGRHLLQLINEVLDLSRVEAGQLDLMLGPLDLDRLFVDCVTLMRVLADRNGVALELEQQAGLQVRGDDTRLKQVLLNLLSNAIKYNRPGGCVRLFAHLQGPEWVRICVQDDGVGIAPEAMDRLFQPFERLGAETTAVEGTGIGLTISRRLVEMMGGLLGVDSKPGQGSTFWVDLPLQPSETVPAALATYGSATQDPEAMSVAPVSQHEAPFRILYVEDNPSNLRLVEQVLAPRQDMELSSATCPVEGLEVAVREQPDLILLDIHMPRMDGFEMLQQLRLASGLESVPVVALSANAMAGDLLQGHHAGFSDYLTKPIDLKAFMGTLERYQKEARTHE